MKLGLLSENYASKRLFLDRIPTIEYKNIRFNNLFLIISTPILILKNLGLLKNISNEELVEKVFYRYKNILPEKCNIYHFFNTVNYSKKTPWVLSVESGVPWTIDVTKAIENNKPDLSVLKDIPRVKQEIQLLAQKQCLALLCLSKSSEKIQKAIIHQFPEYEQAILKKTTTLHPPQELYVNSVEEKGISYNTKNLNFIFIGGEMNRKGGRETINSLLQFKNKYTFHITVVGKLNHKDEDSRYKQNLDDILVTKKNINENKEYITYYESLPNNQVMQLIKKAHVAFLPTWMDTYGYSTLECQACGTPVVTTNLRALSEINNDSCGWTIDVPVNEFGCPINNTYEEYCNYKDKLEKGLIETIEDIFNNTEDIKEKAKRCIERIRLYHNPETYNKYLENLYNKQ
ncbi:glycosyltransferase [Plebeiibacterium sediminum]|uniref:Glycosyltransferase n=1 Tax=Plebeiibacterium sediminum TaxID=2992112 RepID=A0AAE3SF45_9BACT|nr:glycosyltransferase [Plebeiobacterium sediminum]MCW3786647.1 glycosyltransferase [Plebeiobacterium sediminum]